MDRLDQKVRSRPVIRLGHLTRLGHLDQNSMVQKVRFHLADHLDHSDPNNKVRLVQKVRSHQLNQMDHSRLVHQKHRSVRSSMDHLDQKGHLNRRRLMDRKDRLVRLR